VTPETRTSFFLHVRQWRTFSPLLQPQRAQTSPFSRGRLQDPQKSSFPCVGVGSPTIGAAGGGRLGPPLGLDGELPRAGSISRSLLGRSPGSLAICERGELGLGPGALAGSPGSEETGARGSEMGASREARR